MVGISILGIISAGIVSMTTTLFKTQSQTNFLFQIDSTRRSIVNALNSPSSWKATAMSSDNNQASGSMLDCLPMPPPAPIQAGYVCTMDGTSDLSSGGVPISSRRINKIFDAAGSVIYDASNPSFGLNLHGQHCATFVDPSAGPGNNECPFRFDVVWSAICSSTSCLNPQVQLQLIAVYNPGAGAGFVFNSLNYGSPPFIQGNTPGSSSCWAQLSGNLIDVCPGNVGIGTTSPAELLSVFGNISLVSTTNKLIFYDFGATNRAFAQAEPNGDITFSAGTGGVTEKLRIAANGNIGIGIDNPPYPLTIRANNLGQPAISIEGGGLTNPYIQIFNGPIRQGYFGWGPAHNLTYLMSDFNLGLGSGGVEHLRIATGGNVGIGTPNPAYRLHVVGTAGLSTGTAWINASDIRLKEVLGTYDHGLSAILKLRPIRYRYSKNNPLALPSDFESIGFVAQEVQEVIPEAVSKGRHGFLELNVDPIHWAEINAIQELHSKLQQKDQEISQIKNELENLKLNFQALDQKLSNFLKTQKGVPLKN